MRRIASAVVAFSFVSVAAVAGVITNPLTQSHGGSSYSVASLLPMAAEPESVLLLAAGIGLVGLGIWRRKRLN